MLLTMEQMKYLEPVSDDMYIFTGKGKATKKEIEDIKDLDESAVFLYGKHMISNLKDLT